MPARPDPLVALLAMPARSRARVATALLDSLAPDAPAVDVLRELDRRTSEADAGVDGARPWPEVRAELIRSRRRPSRR